MARTNVVFQRFSPSSMVRTNTSPSRLRWIMSLVMAFPSRVAGGEAEDETVDDEVKHRFGGGEVDPDESRAARPEVRPG